MTSEAVFKPKRKPVGYAPKAIKKKKDKRKVIIRRSPMTLQELFECCREVFRGPGTIPLRHDVERLCRILDNMKPEDVGLSSEQPFFQPKSEVEGTPTVNYTTIYKCNNFSLCIFFLPANAIIPLHNHPGMTVFSKLLLGTMHIKSYDLANPISVNEPLPTSQLKLARLIADDDFSAPCSTSVLYPTTGGNIHQFKAVTSCAMLDVLGPPYSAEDGRDCSYYKDYPYAAFSSGKEMLQKEGYGWLEEIEMPEDSHMDGVEYLGPQLVNTSC